MENDELIKAEDYNKTSILLTFESGEKRILDINHLFSIVNDPHLSDSIKQRWKIMYEAGDFFKYKILNGDLVFGGWVEIFAEDLKRQTEDFEKYKFYEREKQLFVHYGSKNYDRNRFREAKNDEIPCPKPDGGLWASPIHSKYSWLDWCADNNFRKYSKENCFYFRFGNPWNWMTVHNKKEWEKLPKRDGGDALFSFVDFDILKEQGVGDGYSICALETRFEDYEEYSECFMGYDCDSIVVLDDWCLFENYDAKKSSNPLQLRDLLPIHFYKEIRENVLVSCLRRSPDDKAYFYVEEPDCHYGFKTLVACVSDGRIVELCGYTEKEALSLIEEVKPYKEELEQILSQKRVLMVH